MWLDAMVYKNIDLLVIIALLGLVIDLRRGRVNVSNFLFFIIYIRFENQEDGVES